MNGCTRLLLGFLLLALACGCGAPPAAGPRNVFRLNLASGNLESTDPAHAKDLYTLWVSHMLYNTLFETDAQLGLAPSLATGYRVSGDGLTYTVSLRPGVRFHDDPAFPGGRGRTMTAADVVYSFDRLIDPATASSGAWIFNDRVRRDRPFTALGDTAVEIHLLAPFRALPQMLSMPYCSVVPREAAERYGKDFRAHPCGTGPFLFKYWDEGNALVLHRNPHYWERDSAGRPLPYLDAVQLSFVDNKATEFLLFMQHKIDFVSTIEGAFKDLVLSKNGTLKPEYAGRFRMLSGVFLNNEYIGFLTDPANPLVKGSPLADVRVRRAICYAVDRQKIVTYYRNGQGIPAYSGFIPPGMPGGGGPYGYRYDPAKARQLLAEAGYPGGRGMAPFAILTPDNYLDIVNFVVSQLQDVGIPARAEVMQPNILRQQMSRSQAPMFRAQWIADYPDAETYLAFFYSPLPAPPNYTRFRDPQFDRWYEQSRALPDTPRWALYRRMDSLVTQQAPVLDLFYDRLVLLVQNGCTGFSTNPMKLIDLKRVRKGS